MTKAQLLHALRRIGLNDEIVFASQRHQCCDSEHDVNHAFVITGRKGLVLVLADEHDVAGEYPDAENAL